MPPKPKKTTASGASGKAPPRRGTRAPKAKPYDRPKAEQRRQDAADEGSAQQDPKEPAPGYKDEFSALTQPFYYGKALHDPINTAEDKWNLLPAFLKVKGLVKQHIDSFNHFVDVELGKIVEANKYVFSDLDKNFWLRYTGIRVGLPTRMDEHEDDVKYSPSRVTPNECRLRDMTYAAPVLVDIEYRRASSRVKRSNLRIARMPIMLRSNKCILTGLSDRMMAQKQECPIDPGGYFIIRGQEKVILVQEQLSKNRIIVECAKGIMQASVTSSTHERKSKTYVLRKKGRMLLHHNTLHEDIPIVIALRALGVESDSDIMTLVAGYDTAHQDEFRSNFEAFAAHNVFSTENALQFVGSKVRLQKHHVFQKRDPSKEAKDCLATVILAHVPVDNDDFRQKALYVAVMARRVLCATLDPSLVDDRDYVGNKRLELAGQMLALLFEDLFKRFNHDLKLSIDKALRRQYRSNAMDAYDHFGLQGNPITTGIERAMATGNWNLRRFKMERAGVTHVLSRLSFIAAIGMMTRISSQFEKTRKVSGPRALQPSQFGMLCPSDTPEGEACGLVKNLALMTHITTQDEEPPILQAMRSLNVSDMQDCDSADMYARHHSLVFLNGTPVAWTLDSVSFARAFRASRRRGAVSAFTSIHRNDHHNSVHIATDEGRICRPLIIVQKGQSRVTARHLEALRQGAMEFDDFLKRGLVEYLDVNEENDAYVALREDDMGPQTTHLEIEPFTILGAVAGLIPYPHHNQSPRNTYQCAMGKQAIGAIAYNQFTRIDSLLYIMVYPQKPLVKTRTIELVHYDKLPAGQNAVVAVMSYSGYDIEDALVLNKASCDRGFGRCQVFKKLGTVLKNYANGTSDCVNASFLDDSKKEHAKLGDDGLVEVGAQLENEDVYMLKSTPVPTQTGRGAAGGRSHAVPSGGIHWREAPSRYMLPDPSYVDKVMISENEAGTRIIKIQTRQTRRPENGDKFSSRHGQKGVVGLIAQQEDMPFSDEGIVPDVIMNPHGFPSRMTVGKMLELMAGKAGVLRGQFEYGTAFGGSPAGEMAQGLLDKGFSYHGKDYLTSGITGEALACYVFFGPIYYQKLKHMVQDKMHARARGPRAALTRQPTEGRSREGGLRLGEMERDCLIAYGAGQLLRERLMLSSDVHRVGVCVACGALVASDECTACSMRAATAAHAAADAAAPRGSAAVQPVTLPYAAKLLIQELGAMNIQVHIGLQDELADD